MSEAVKDNSLKTRWARIHSKLKHTFTETKFGQVWIKYRLQYLAYTLLMEAVMAGLYFIATRIPTQVVTFDTTIIDDKIPFISYFYFFYLFYYVVPELALWALSFWDKKKSLNLTSSCIVMSFLAFICYCSCQVRMVRPQAEAIVAEYANFSSVYNLDTFFKWAVNLQYTKLDPIPVNCMPSLHCAVSSAVVLTAIPTGKGEGKFPIGWRIFFGLFGLGIILSTFIIKQHYFFDAIAGTFGFVLVYFIMKLLVVPAIDKHREKKKLEKQTLASENK